MNTKETLNYYCQELIILSISFTPLIGLFFAQALPNKRAYQTTLPFVMYHVYGPILFAFLIAVLYKIQVLPLDMTLDEFIFSDTQYLYKAPKQLK